MTASRLRSFLLTLLPLLLVACGGASTTANVAASDDDDLMSGDNGQDPLLAAVVHDPIMTDPQLSFRSNADAIRPPSQPYAAPIPASDIAPAPDTDDGASMTAPDPAPGPCRDCAAARDALTLGALVARQSDPRMQRCAASLAYAAGWANRLPADVPLYGSARVIEAAGVDGGTCHVRAVTFATRRSPAQMLGWYSTRMSRAGFTTTHQAADGEHVLTGARARDGGTVAAFVRDGERGGSEIDLLVGQFR